MKRWILVMICAFLYVMPVNATELGAEETGQVVESEDAVVNEEESVAEEVSQEGVSEENASQENSSEVSEEEQESVELVEESSSESVNIPEAEAESVPTTEESTEEAVAPEVEIPDITGMSEADAIVALEAVVLADGSKIEIIKQYKYSNDAEAGFVIEQNPVGIISEEEAKQVTIFISMGKDPKETVVDGITEPLNQTINSAFGINWSSLPEYYDYNWDNSANCWEHGVWIKGEKFLTPKGTYNTNVRHMIQLYTDGTYVYTHIVFSRDYEAAANGNWFNYTIDGHTASFQVETYNGIQLANNNLAPGTYQVVVHHADGSNSYNVAADSSAYYTVFDSQVNAHLEIKIPLSEMAAQNENIDIENVGSIQFYTPNLMRGSVTASGASTFPFATAAAALILVPGSAVLINRKKKSAKKESNEK